MACNWYVCQTQGMSIVWTVGWVIGGFCMQALLVLCSCWSWSSYSLCWPRRFSSPYRSSRRQAGQSLGHSAMQCVLCMQVIKCTRVLRNRLLWTILKLQTWVTCVVFILQGCGRNPVIPILPNRDLCPLAHCDLLLAHSCRVSSNHYHHIRAVLLVHYVYAAISLTAASGS